MDEQDAAELRHALIRASIAILPILAIFGAQWWITTSEPERMVAFRKVGLTRCSQGRWHWYGMPRTCLCRWVEGTVDQRLRAGLAEREREG